MAIRSVVFDLFDTLVDLRAENIPAEQVGAHKLPASVRALHEEVARVSGTSFDDFAAALGEGRGGRRREQKRRRSGGACAALARVGPGRRGSGRI